LAATGTAHSCAPLQRATLDASLSWAILDWLLGDLWTATRASVIGAARESGLASMDTTNAGNAAPELRRVPAGGRRDVLPALQSEMICQIKLFSRDS
jgi:hypothetical protein